MEPTRRIATELAFGERAADRREGVGVVHPQVVQGGSSPSMLGVKHVKFDKDLQGVSQRACIQDRIRDIGVNVGSPGESSVGFIGSV